MKRAIYIILVSFIVSGCSFKMIKSGCKDFHKEVERGNIETVKKLIEEGCPVNYKNEYGYYALALAIFKGHSDIIELLLKKGANANKGYDDGDHRKSALSMALVNSENNTIKLLIEYGADINEVDGGCMGTGMTPLAYAARARNPEIVRFLLIKGADINGKSSGSATALSLALLKGNEEVVKILLKNGADVNIKDYAGKTALTHAKEKGFDEMAKILKEAGAKE